ncbi:hypothetical protein VST7929_02968 [Vibrio stylophorae]|uniref:YopX protein domain-containing protein n=1 Tax=Vibrio stylophorae TaxID=659351 RepID=A0ABM8ZXE3_9VIBR|nr:hypothetical protein [Vibrio stylophorae]CAH0535395.1 hypothetical protein VST7929_02968 [Vibrio stylophorae]
MKYTDGNQSKLGDSVQIDDKYFGVVVVDVDAGEYSKPYPKEVWSYLSSGILVDTDFGGLVHYVQDTLTVEKMVLIKRHI